MMDKAMDPNMPMVGDRVKVVVTPHMDGHEEGVVRQVVHGALGIEFDDMPGVVHQWYVPSEVMIVSRGMDMEEKPAEEMSIRKRATEAERRMLPKAHCELRFDEDNGTIHLRGYAAVFNSFSEDLGGFREIIRPGAFGRSLSGNPDVRLLINHDGMPLARTTSNTLRLYEDKRGLKVDANLDASDPDVQRLSPKMKRGDMDQMSFGFYTRTDSWRTENGQDVRELHDVDLFDVSVVTFPAYPATEVGLRSYQVWKQQLQQASQEQLEAEAMAKAEARSRHLLLIGRR